MVHTSCYASPVGNLLLAEQAEKLTGLWIEGRQQGPRWAADEEFLRLESPVLTQTKQWLDRYFSGQMPSISQLPLAPAGSAFRLAVWELLCQIPYGATTTYGSLAKQLAGGSGKIVSAQAVGGAVGHNPISIIIPCHRVVGSNGSLTGYAGGLAIKVQLLTHENVDMTRLFLPAKGTAL